MSHNPKTTAQTHTEGDAVQAGKVTHSLWISTCGTDGVIIRTPGLTTWEIYEEMVLNPHILHHEWSRPGSELLTSIQDLRAKK